MTTRGSGNCSAIAAARAKKAPINSGAFLFIKDTDFQYVNVPPRMLPAIVFLLPAEFLMVFKNRFTLSFA